MIDKIVLPLELPNGIALPEEVAEALLELAKSDAESMDADLLKVLDSFAESQQHKYAYGRTTEALKREMKKLSAGIVLWEAKTFEREVNEVIAKYGFNVDADFVEEERRAINKDEDPRRFMQIYNQHQSNLKNGMSPHNALERLKRHGINSEQELYSKFLTAKGELPESPINTQWERARQRTREAEEAAERERQAFEKENARLAEFERIKARKASILQSIAFIEAHIEKHELNVDSYSAGLVDSTGVLGDRDFLGEMMPGGYGAAYARTLNLLFESEQYLRFLPKLLENLRAELAACEKEITNFINLAGVASPQSEVQTT